MEAREVVLVTGSRKGIGRFLAEHFVKKGSLVEGCSRKMPDWELPNYTHHLADVTDDSQVKTMIQSISRRHGRLDVAVNNAGIASMNHTLLTPARAVDRILATNFVGTFRVSREAAKIMMKRKYGRIINVSSVAVPLRLEGEGVYAASKQAVEMLTRILAHELSAFGITCNVVAPAPLATDLIREVPPKKIDLLLGRLAVKQLGSLQDVANVIDFFCSEKSSGVTGQVIYLGGVS